MTAHTTMMQHHIPLKNSFLQLRTCGARRLKTPHHVVRRRKITMLSGYSKTSPVVPCIISDDRSSSDVDLSESPLLKSIRRGYVRRVACYRDEPAVSLVNAKRSRALLKWDEDHEMDDSDVDDDSSSRAHDRVVNFDPHVSVVEIPSRKAYSPRVSQAMWNNRKEIRRSAARNAIEYAFEQYDWQGAAEEKDFFRNASGLLIHPAHIALEESTKSPSLVAS